MREITKQLATLEAPASPSLPSFPCSTARWCCRDKQRNSPNCGSNSQLDSPFAFSRSCFPLWRVKAQILLMIKKRTSQRKRETIIYRLDRQTDRLGDSSTPPPNTFRFHFLNILCVTFSVSFFSSSCYRYFSCISCSCFLLFLMINLRGLSCGTAKLANYGS